MLTVQAQNKTYDIVVERGCLATIGQQITKIWSPRQILIITDSHVAPLYAETVITQLENVGFTVTMHVITAGEQHKTLATVATIYDILSAQHFTRTDSVLALGGGVVGDIAGYAASTYLRGLSFVQVPTTLLAQVDSSIGGKTGVNLAQGKNLVGTFAQPDYVLIDSDVLQTLPSNHLRAGFAEIIKAAAIGDTVLWQQLTQLTDISATAPQLTEIILSALKVKQRFVEADVLDRGQRQCLNFGHTIGHALEQANNYTLLHGEAVSIGMVQITQQSERQGLTQQGTTQALMQLLQQFALPTHLSAEADVLYEAITHDKKTSGQQLNIIVLEKIGHPKIVQIPLTAMKDYLA